MSSSQIATVVAGVCGSMFLAYCIYFDYKRRSDPDYKKKLIEKRAQRQEADAADMQSRIPDLTDTAAVQKFFLEEVQIGEDLLTKGEYESAVKHLTNAVAVCGQPQQLLQVFKQTLPPAVFQMLIDNINQMKDVTHKVP
ncbi:predicted protein [Nematostella vectensis]|uniref:Mitochondrial import receptor subunit TOM20 homolog n=2 Tax=Nematostella vectensis TaxID=45351 RepID=A7RJB2_NEMVE|nr:predicted protein [Nematostella vectensis]|eukprot:XP_001640710.1 predicted protein [Nematostella vectensis]